MKNVVKIVGYFVYLTDLRDTEELEGKLEEYIQIVDTGSDVENINVIRAICKTQGYRLDRYNVESSFNYDISSLE